MQIYEYDCYRAYTRDWVEEKKRLGFKVTFQGLAEKIGVQKAYLSRVLKMDADLNSDQAYLLMKELSLAPPESEYFLLLLEYSRTSLIERKRSLKTNIKEAQGKYFYTDNHLDKKSLKLFKEEKLEFSESYHLNPYNQLVHVALTIDRFRENPDKLREALNISQKEFNAVLEYLEKCGFITIKEGQVFVLDSAIHLSRDSQKFWPWYQQMINLTNNRSRSLNSQENLNFTVTFSGNQETFSSFKTDVLKLLEKFQKRVESAPSENLYQLTFDLMNWQV
ncbi:MAG: TIGR02147 family protein [Halobacteriovoraceae bacterium]|nr:TIGR02147 family protein [Halobacteriovoraceae bacterium]